MNVSMQTLLLLLTLFGADGNELTNRIGELLDSVQAQQSRAQVSDEEIRLQRFWDDYYASLGRYYEYLGKLDWVAYYKNHGQQIGGENANPGTQRIQFRPVVVTPQMGGAVPHTGWSIPDRLLPPGHLAVLKSMALAELEKNNDSAVQPAKAPPEFAPAVGTFTVTLKWFEAKSPGVAKEVLNCAPIKVRKDGGFAVTRATPLFMYTGTAQDLSGSAQPLVQAAHTIAPAASSAPAPVGTMIQGKISPLAVGHVRLDLSLEKNDVESASKTNLIMAGRTYRLAQQLRLGQRTRIVLQNDPAGEPRLWLEVTVQDGTALDYYGAP